MKQILPFIRMKKENKGWTQWAEKEKRNMRTTGIWLMC